jgi:hypothetical protein
VASGCATAKDHSTASGGDCNPPEHEKAKRHEKTTPPVVAIPVAESHPLLAGEAAQEAGGASLARTGVAAGAMALSSALALVLGTLLLMLGSLDRLRKGDRGLSS